MKTALPQSRAKGPNGMPALGKALQRLTLGLTGDQVATLEAIGSILLPKRKQAHEAAARLLILWSLQHLPDIAENVRLDLNGDGWIAPESHWMPQLKALAAAIKVVRGASLPKDEARR